ncbi:MAG: RsmE family RNA methyltransferase, partial [Abditibacteriota bacterium]|nr:RsmE family RNA methyltransferase [Abditibacteriota bacterium]
MKSQYRFYVERELVSGCCFIAGPSLAYQLGRVLRLAGGDTVSLFGTNGREFLSRVDFAGRDVTLTPFRDVTVPREPAARLTLLLALSKGDKPETQVQKCTELGAAGFVFVTAGRSVARPRDTEARTARLRRIACEAAEQCGRVTVPDIRFAELCDIDPAPYGVRLVCSGPSGRP